MSYLPCIEVEPPKSANAAVIWLHGLGASGHDFEPLVAELQLPAYMAVRFIFPHAPSIPVTINGGMVMPAWFDIVALDWEHNANEAQILESAAATSALVDREIERGIDSKRIVVAGFSQGGTIAYQAALTYPKPLAGLMALSSHLATYKTLVPHEANKNLAIHLFHGIYDPMVPEAMGKYALAILSEWGYKVDYKYYPVEHAVPYHSTD